MLLSQKFKVILEVLNEDSNEISGNTDMKFMKKSRIKPLLIYALELQKKVSEMPKIKVV